MCYTEWSRKELEALQRARKEAEDLVRRAAKPKPGGQTGAPAPREQAPASEPEPVST
jgi:hypothetical protein